MSTAEHDNTSLDPAKVADATLDALFLMRVERTPDAPAYRAFYRDAGEWRSYNWRETALQVGRWQQALREEGLQEGDRVALNLRNSPEWVHFEQAALGLGLVVVPLYTDDRADNLAYILEETDARLLLIQDIGRWRRVADTITEEALPHLERIIALEGEDDGSEPRLRSAAQWLPQEGSLPQHRPGKPEELATIVFTSGTSGRPKGVMLSHRNIIRQTIATSDRAGLDSRDRLLSFLPLAHMYERSGGYYLPMIVGAEICYARSVAQLSNDLLEQQPSAFFTVPRIFERIQTKLDEQLSQASPVKRGLFKLAVNAGWRRFRYQKGHASWHPLILLAPLMQRLVGDKVLAKFGGRLRFVGSGGAPLSATIARTFVGLGVPIFQGYGMTEASPVICGNRDEDNDPLTIGPALEGVEIKLGQNNELLTRSPCVMMGYWNNHAATAQAIDKEGWLHTGDQAEIGPRGHVRITGRIKDIIVLSNGEKVPPADMELAICAEPLFEQAVVVGEGQAYLSALLVLNGEQWPAFAQECGVDPLDEASLQQKKVVSRVLKMLAERLHEFPGYAKVRRVYLTLEPWTIDNGLLTPTLKVKRPRVLEQFKAEVERLYNDGGA